MPTEHDPNNQVEQNHQLPWRKRWLNAFSLSDNLDRLWIPPEHHQRTVDGLRAWAILWVIIFHSVFFLKLYIPDVEMKRWVADQRLKIVWEGDFGVDIFFVISGYLIAGSLLREWFKHGQIRIRRFYLRRAMRLLPAYYVGLFLYAKFLVINRENIWANILYINNFLPFLRQAMGWSWSLAIEEQFYLIFPWWLLLMFRIPSKLRAWWIAFFMALSVAFCALVVSRYKIMLWEVDMVPTQNVFSWVKVFDYFYDKPMTRYGALLLGVTAAWVEQQRVPWWEKLVDRTWFRWLLGLLCGAVLVWTLRLVSIPVHLRWMEVWYLASYRQLFALVVTIVLLMSLRPSSRFGWLRRVLGLRMWFPIAQLSYSAYLLNPFMSLITYGYLARPPPVFDLATVLWFMLINIIMTLAGASLLYLLVERPIMNLRPQFRTARNA
jgi:peptidoglycan/LPS O-acetylase OafA/YrhL